MINRNFDRNKQYSYVRYARFSDTDQNPRSCTQQFDCISKEIELQKLPWKMIGSYQDDGISGRYMKKRPGLQAMLRDIRTGTIRPNLILLHTRERLARSEEITAIRKELLNRYAVYILTANNGFSDPTTSEGKVHAAIEEMWATEDNRKKASFVLRGKIDAVKRKHWPGGKPPRGHKLQRILVERNGRTEVDGSQLIEDEEWSPIINLLFTRAATTGHGQTRLANWFNSNEDIPDQYKPLSGSSIGTLLDNELHIGEFHFPKHCTDVIDDIRVRELHDPSVTFVVQDFCSTIIPRELWDRVHALRDARREVLRQAREGGSKDDKLIRPLAAGLNIRHLLSGLARCGHCGASMRPSGPSLKVDPSSKYAYFRCPRSLDGICGNTRSIPVKWLTGVVVDLLQRNLFPGF